MDKRNPNYQQMLDDTERRYRVRIAEMGGMSGDVEAFQRPHASAPARLRNLTADILADMPRSEFGLYCFKESHFDPRKPRRLISGIAISSGARNGNGNVFVAKGMRKVSLPTPFFFRHERLIGRVTFARAIGDAVRFQAELANTASSFADRVWNDIVGRRLDGASVGGINLSGKEVVDGVYTEWGVREISVALRGADDAAVIDRCWEMEPGVFLGRAPVKLHWQGPLTSWDAELATRNMYLPRESDESAGMDKSGLDYAAGLSARLRDQLSGLKR